MNCSGALRNLRESTSHKKVQSYHKKFYRPDNLCLIITGQVEPEQVLKTLYDFESLGSIKVQHTARAVTDAIYSTIAKCVHPRCLPQNFQAGFHRPWTSPVPPLESAHVEWVKYPSDEENNGLVLMGWRGPFAKVRVIVHKLLSRCTCGGGE